MIFFVVFRLDGLIYCSKAKIMKERTDYHNTTCAYSDTDNSVISPCSSNCSKCNLNYNLNDEKNIYLKESENKEKLRNFDKFKCSDRCSCRGINDENINIFPKKIATYPKFQLHVNKKLDKYLQNQEYKIKLTNEIRRVKENDVFEFIILIYIRFINSFKLPTYVVLDDYDFVKCSELLKEIRNQKNKNTHFAFIITLFTENSKLVIENSELSKSTHTRVNSDFYEDDIYETIENMMPFIKYMTEKYNLKSRQKSEFIIIYTYLLQKILTDENNKTFGKSKKLLGIFKKLLINRDLISYSKTVKTGQILLFYREILRFFINYMPKNKHFTCFYFEFAESFIDNLFSSIFKMTRKINKDEIFDLHLRKITKRILNILYKNSNADLFWKKILYFINSLHDLYHLLTKDFHKNFYKKSYEEKMEFIKMEKKEDDNFQKFIIDMHKKSENYLQLDEVKKSLKLAHNKKKVTFC
ncbi:hypothetical protein DMUE_1446 [Dictyocoela muelleri]|nr:hypothetical protein DMUE_1446 [Dictyocoela muelleri]